MTLKTELKMLTVILVLMATMLGSAYATYRVDRHVITTLKRDNRELRAVAADETTWQAALDMAAQSLPADYPNQPKQAKIGKHHG